MFILSLSKFTSRFNLNNRGWHEPIEPINTMSKSINGINKPINTEYYLLYYPRL